MKYLLLILFIACLSPLSAQPDNAKKQIAPLEHILKIHLIYPDSALHLLDTLKKGHQIPLYLIDAYRAMIYAGQSKHRLTINYAQKALANDSLQQHPNYYLQTLSYLEKSYHQLAAYKESLQILRQGIDFARETNNLSSEANFLFTAGQNYYLLNDRTEAFECFHRAIKMGEKDPTQKLKPYLSYFYGELCNILINEQCYKKALDICSKREKLIQQMEQYKKIPLGYLDQQYAYLYSKQALLFSKLNQPEEAVRCYQKFAQTQTSRKPQGLSNILPYWINTQQYNQIIQYLLQQEVPADTIQENYAINLATLAQAYEGKKQYEIACHYLQRLAVIRDSLNQRNHKENIAELTSIYQLKEKQYELNLNKAQLQEALLVRNWIAGALLLACILLWTLWRHFRTIQRKNLLMANNINTVLACEEKIESLEKQLTDAPSDQPVNDKTDYLMFKRIEKIIKDEKMFLKADLNRQDILDQLNMDKNYFAKLMQSHTQMSLPQYLNNLRVKHAIGLLKTRPNYTIKAIADESGFNNLRSFQRIFKSVTGLTPSEYKSAINRED